MLNTGFPSILTKAEGGSELGPHPKQSASPLSISHGSSPSASQRRTGLWSHASQYQILLACMNPMSSELDCFGLKVLLQNIGYDNNLIMHVSHGVRGLVYSRLSQVVQW